MNMTLVRDRMGLVCTGLMMIVTGCSNADSEAIDREKIEMRARIEAALSDLENEIGTLEREVETAGDEVRDDLNADIDRLEEVKNGLKASLDNVGDTAEENWDDFRRSIDRALEDARRSIDNARQRMTG